MEKKKTSEEILQGHLGILSTLLGQCLSEATPTEDGGYGDRRHDALGHAVLLLKASARLGMALAKLKGEFRHNINVARDTPSKN